MKTDSGPFDPGPLKIIPQWLRRLRRKQDRAAKRETIHAAFHPNSKREVERRQRQIARGQLRVSA